MSYSTEERKVIYRRLCEAIANGLSVGKACEMDGMPMKSTIFLWLSEDRDFSDQYIRAREARADVRFERIDELKEEVRVGLLDVNVGRFLYDAERWQMGRENAKRYSERTTIQGADDAPPVKVESTVVDGDKKQLARWIALKLTQGAGEADKDTG